jgi:hypothetical protein
MKQNQTKSTGRGGARAGAGRKPGSPNKKTAELQAAVAETGETPLDFLLRIMRDDKADEARRIDCAKAAAQYIHPKLSAVDMNADVNATVVGEVVFRGLNG